MEIPFYQTIPDLNIVGRMHTPGEFDLIGMPKDLTGKSVLDIGCNTGAFLIEAKRRGAGLCVGIEPDRNWRWLAIGIAKELGMEIEYYESLPFDKYWGFDLVLCLSVTHLDTYQGDELETAISLCNEMAIVEINNRLQKKDDVVDAFTQEAEPFGTNKDNRSVWHYRPPKDEDKH